MQLMHVSSIRALFWSGVINGLIAPFLLGTVLLAASDRSIMRDRISPAVERTVVGAAVAAMIAAAAVWVL